MPPRVRKLLSDVVKACRLIAEFVGDMSYRQYAADLRTQAACERHLMIAGEAIARMQREHPDWASRITQAKAIKAFRNIVVHEYERVDDEVVYGIITRYVPMLCDEADQMLKNQG